MFDTDKYNVIGIKKIGLDNYIGLFVTSIEDNYPWLGYFLIEKKYRKKITTIVLAHYLINILHKDKMIQIGQFDKSGYSKLIKSFPKSLGISILKEEVGTRVEKIINKDIT